MREEPEKYVKGGGLNPFWIDWDMERCSREQQDDNNFADLFDRNINELYERELEAKFQFLKRHSDSEEDLKLAKQILGL